MGPGVQKGSPACGDHSLAARQAQVVEEIRRSFGTKCRAEHERVMAAFNRDHLAG
jgi:hypothetical protein